MMSAGLPAKLAVLSHVVPPSPTGQSVVLYRLLSPLRPQDYITIASERQEAEAAALNAGRLPGRSYRLPPERQLPRPGPGRFWAPLEVPNVLLRIGQRALAVTRIIRRERCGAIVACSGSVADLPAGYLAGRLAGVPFYAYLFDDYVFQWASPFYRKFLGWMAPVVMRGAARVIVPNEFLRDAYRRRYRVSPVVIRNPAVSRTPPGNDPIAWPSSPGQIKIVYTGAVYHANFAAFRNMVAAIELLDRADLQLHLYTSQPPQVLDQEDIRGPVEYHGHLPADLVAQVQREADILFMPLSINSLIPEVIATSAPGKMGEYLASGRPILVHAPSDSFASWYFRRHRCGVVVDRDDPGALAAAIQRIVDEPELRQEIIANALACATRDFSVDGARARFLEVLRKGD